MPVKERRFPPPPLEKADARKGVGFFFIREAGIEAEMAPRDSEDEAAGCCRKPSETARRETAGQQRFRHQPEIACSGRLEGIPATSTKIISKEY